MIDGIKLNCHINDFPAWERATNIETSTPVNLNTGEIKAIIQRSKRGNLYKTITRFGKFETYRINVKEVRNIYDSYEETTAFYFTLDGSLHKNNFGGENYKPFTWNKLQSQICHVETGLCLNSEKVNLVRLEFGVNINLSFPVFNFLQKNLISYRGKQFNSYALDRKGLCLGYYCELSEYTVKIYDKGAQYNLPDPLMRFELRFKKMRKLNQLGIDTLSDLKNKEKMCRLRGLLLSAWDEVLLFDNSIRIDHVKVKDSERELLNRGNNPKFWEAEKERLSNPGFHKRKNMFKKLISLYGLKRHEQIKELINDEFVRLLNSVDAVIELKKVDNITIKVKDEIVYHDICYLYRNSGFSPYDFGRVSSMMAA